MNGLNMSDVTNYMLGSIQVSEVYYGSTKIWPKSHDYSGDYFTIQSLDDNIGIKFAWISNLNYNNYIGTQYICTIYYSTDLTNWTAVDATSANQSNAFITLGPRQKVYIKANNQQYSWVDFNLNNYIYNHFIFTSIDYNGRVKVSGNIMSLIYGDNFANQTSFPQGSSQNFYEFFIGQDIISNISNLILPATTLTEYCYFAMFDQCDNIAAAPELPATTLAPYCYARMFEFCGSLLESPELPATTLASHCYFMMFNSCTSLTAAPELPATTLAESCYSYMLEECDSITIAPELPATTLAPYCYYNMFWMCDNLTTAPELPATTLASYCYSHMFDACTSLTTAPELPATTLADFCYSAMFQDCTSLSSVTCLATNISATGCTLMWLYNVAASGTFTKAASMSNWTTGDSGIPSGWTCLNY